MFVETVGYVQVLAALPPGLPATLVFVIWPRDTRPGLWPSLGGVADKRVHLLHSRGKVGGFLAGAGTLSVTGPPVVASLFVESLLLGPFRIKETGHMGNCGAKMKVTEDAAPGLPSELTLKKKAELQCVLDADGIKREVCSQELQPTLGQCPSLLVCCSSSLLWRPLCLSLSLSAGVLLERGVPYISVCAVSKPLHKGSTYGLLSSDVPGSEYVCALCSYG